MTDKVNVAAVLPAPKADLVLQERPVSSPGPDEVLIRNHAIALNPIDWKRQELGLMVNSYPAGLGADLSGIVAEVGSSVTGFKPGDRVFGFGNWVSKGLDHVAYQAYTLVESASASLVPPSTSLLQAATLPTAIGTATMGLFSVLDLPRPGTAVTSSPLALRSILIWGGASTVASMAIQFARLAGLTVFTTASKKHHAYLRSLGASVVVDYNSPTAVEELVAAAASAGTEIAIALDCISLPHTLTPTIKVLSSFTGGGPKKLAHLVPWSPDFAKPDAGIEVEWVPGEDLWDEKEELLNWLLRESLPKWLEEGAVVPLQYRVIPGGLSGLQNGLNELKKGASGEKLVVEL
ncbi:chaperonin 10-like protein [Lasiosphaeria miniovina]|uniref:Chaperonin 10-like protein n=1 Tax=Lasiosphaeria miniovina TaxID=1954250 RepID=A0AA39ZYV8_9PEZI|nr:chaperonin 10-like protein [Lasiosphaeria miniovina]KAK0706181.1 chaperonin 10-like protein [Lasiosphaeria miniovina]